MFKILRARLQQYVNWELPDIQVGFRKGRGARDQIVNIYWIMENQGNSTETSTSASLTVLKPLTVWIIANWKILKEIRIPKHHTFRTRHGTMDWFKTGKGVCQGIYWHPDYLTYLKRTSCQMLGWMNHKLESRLPGEISTASDMDMIQLYDRKWRQIKSSLDES